MSYPRLRGVVTSAGRTLQSVLKAGGEAMNTDAIRESIQKAASYLREHPSEARYMDSVATATLDDGLRVKVEGASGEQIANGHASVCGWQRLGSVSWLALPCGARQLRCDAHRHEGRRSGNSAEPAR